MEGMEGSWDQEIRKLRAVGPVATVFTVDGEDLNPQRPQLRVLDGT